MSGDMQLYELARAAQNKAILKNRRKAQASRPPENIRPEPMLSPSQRAGRRAEEKARLHLEQLGLLIIGCNLRSKTGEIDLVARDHGVLVFIEVRQRRSRQYGGAAASVNRAKQQRLVRTALYYLPRLRARYFQGRTPPCRFDVVSLEGEGLVWVRHAFDMG